MKRALFALAVGFALNAPTAFGAVTDEQVQQLLDRIEAQDKRIAELEKASQRPQSVAAAPTTVSTPPEAAKPAPSAWTDKVSLQGDLRYRYETIDDHGSSGDKNRQRIRARAAIVAKPQSNLEIGFGLSTAENNDPISANQTLGADGSRKSVYIDLAYFNWTALEGLNVIGGKFKDFLYRPQNYWLLWDNDWNPEGLGVTYVNGPFFGNVIGTSLQSDSSSTSGSEFTLGGQLGVTPAIGDLGKLTAGVGYYSFNTRGKGTFYGTTTAFAGNSFDPLTNKYLYDYREFEAFGNFAFKLAGIPAAIFGDYVHNSAVSNFNTGWAAGAQLGLAKSKGSWQVSYAYENLQADAVFGAVTDSDFGGGGTDAKGSVIRGAYALSDNTNLAATYFANQSDANLGTEHDYSRLQLDLNLKY